MRMLTAYGLLFAKLNAYSKRRRCRYASCICINWGFSAYALGAHEIPQMNGRLLKALLERWIRVSGLETRAILAKCKLPRCRSYARHHSLVLFCCCLKMHPIFSAFVSCFAVKGKGIFSPATTTVPLDDGDDERTNEEKRKMNAFCIQKNKIYKRSKS